ncbi:MAG: hypothetical protein GF417_02200 [Candidatus Latescibacteria bacterium]|nr:hypothetical protein [bacterium]MBD3423241.1 hypothetical protein [Candidatus Latescibacterota bacterium]
MIILFTRNRVRDYRRWKAVFDANLDSAHEAGLELINLWRSVEDSNNLFFSFRVRDIDRARSFLNDPASQKAGEESGVIDGEYYFLESVQG